MPPHGAWPLESSSRRNSDKATLEAIAFLARYPAAESSKARLVRSVLNFSKNSGLRIFWWFLSQSAGRPSLLKRDGSPRDRRGECHMRSADRQVQSIRDGLLTRLPLGSQRDVLATTGRVSHNVIVGSHDICATKIVNRLRRLLDFGAEGRQGLVYPQSERRCVNGYGGYERLFVFRQRRPHAARRRTVDESSAMLTSIWTRDLRRAWSAR
jgi:hypothetical protein